MIFRLKLWYKKKKKRLNQRNRFRNAAGISTCRHCGGAWNWKQRETVWYYEGRGMFPLCKECFQELSEEEILYYCKRKWDEDKRRSRRDGDYTDAQRELGNKDFLENALESIRGKKNDSEEVQNK